MAARKRHTTSGYPPVIRRSFLVLILAVLAAGCSSDKKVDPLTGRRVEPPQPTRSPVRVAGVTIRDHVEGAIDYTTTKYLLPDQAPPAPPLGVPTTPSGCAAVFTPSRCQTSTPCTHWSTARPG